MFCRDADLFTQQKRASPRDGLITQSTRKAVIAGALFCFVEKPTGGGNRHLEGLTMNDDRMTVVPDFLGELDAGVFMNKIAAALNTVGLGVLNNGNKGNSLLTGDEPRFVLRIVQLEAQEEAIANEFRDLLISKFDGESVETFIGNFKA